MNFNKFEKLTTFTLEKTFTWGVKYDEKYKTDTIPIVVNDEVKMGIQTLATIHNAKDPVPKNKLYLKSKDLLIRQKEELLDQGIKDIKICFVADGVYETEKGNFLVFKVKGLKKLTADDAPADDF